MKMYTTKITLSNLNLKEPLEIVYIYQDFIKQKFSIFYNDELKFPINIEKQFMRNMGRVKNPFTSIIDVKIQYKKENDYIELTYIYQ